MLNIFVHRGVAAAHIKSRLTSKRGSCLCGCCPIGACCFGVLGLNFVNSLKYHNYDRSELMLSKVHLHWQLSFVFDVGIMREA